MNYMALSESLYIMKASTRMHGSHGLSCLIYLIQIPILITFGPINSRTHKKGLTKPFINPSTHPPSQLRLPRKNILIMRAAHTNLPIHRHNRPPHMRQTLPSTHHLALHPIHPRRHRPQIRRRQRPAYVTCVEEPGTCDR